MATSTNNLDAVRHKQACADRLQEIVEAQIILGRQIQQLSFKPTPEMMARMDVLIDDYAKARAAYVASSENCDVPVFVTPIQRPL